MERKRILIAVNLSPDIEKLRKALVTSGYEVKIVDNGISALSMSREFRPHLILSELNLSKIDGHHLLRELKSQPATKMIPFILMSKHRSVDERVHSINLGVDDYITVPFDIREVLLKFEVILKEIETFEAIPKRNSKGFSGRLSDMNLIELMQTFDVGKKSGIVKLENGDSEGIIFFKAGEILDASLDALNPIQALFRMFTWSDGTFRVEIREIEQSREFDKPTEELIFEGLAYRDRWEKICKYLPPLQTFVKLDSKIVEENLSADEKSVLSLVDDKTRMVDLVEKSKLDDLKALKIVARLFSQGALHEISLQQDETQDGSAYLNGPNRNGHHNQISDLIVNFLNPHENGSAKRATERRRNERRSKTERRIRPRRWSDFIGEKNRIYLNKSELLMIREKLSNGSSRGRTGTPKN